MSDALAVLAAPTPDEARWLGLQGWNLRCNRCGLYGATWVPNQRPGWGALALCQPHAYELREEVERHDKAMRALREVRFEQPIPAPQMPSMAEDRRRRRAFEDGE
jgi:hypothetical protein